MKSLHKIFTHCLIFLACTLSVQVSIAQSITQPAAPKASRATAQKMMKVMNAEKLLDEMLNNSIKVAGDEVSNLIIQNLNIKNLTPEDEKILLKFKYDLEQIYKKEFSSSKLTNQILDLYTTHFTEQELQDAIAFYQTPSGQSMLIKLPALMNDFMQNSMMKDLEQFQKKFIPIIEDTVEQLRNNHPS